VFWMFLVCSVYLSSSELNTWSTQKVGDRVLSVPSGSVIPAQRGSSGESSPEPNQGQNKGDPKINPPRGPRASFRKSQRSTRWDVRSPQKHAPSLLERIGEVPKHQTSELAQEHGDDNDVRDKSPDCEIPSSREPNHSSSTTRVEVPADESPNKFEMVLDKVPALPPAVESQGNSNSFVI
jgi:hypothetical protein